MRALDPLTKARVDRFLAEKFRSDSRFDQGFPEHFEAYLFLYSNYLNDQIFQSIFQAARSIGNAELIFIVKEKSAEGPVDQIVGVDEESHLAEHMDWALESYLTAPDFEWLVWAYHEPCLHIGGSARFISAFQAAYPSWEAEYSPWYEEGGIPVCSECGAWWHPGWGAWRRDDWKCPQCLGLPARGRMVNRSGFPDDRSDDRRE